MSTYYNAAPGELSTDEPWPSSNGKKQKPRVYRRQEIRHACGHTSYRDVTSAQYLALMQRPCATCELTSAPLQGATT